MFYRIAVLFFFVAVVYAEEPLSFATWNLRYANARDSLEGNGWSKRLTPISNIIRYSDLDIIALQEMDGSDSIPMTDMLLDNLPGYDVVTCADSLCDDYNPILYKRESIHLVEKGIFWFGVNPDIAEKSWDAMLRRYCTWAKFEKNGYLFYVFNVHWDHKGPQARRESALLSVKKVKEITDGASAIFAGDLNCQKKYDCYYLLKADFWHDAEESADFVYLQDSTFNRFKNGIGVKNIDHVFVTNDIHVFRYGVLRETYFDGEKWRNASDHSPIRISVELTRKNKEH